MQKINLKELKSKCKLNSDLVKIQSKVDLISNYWINSLQAMPSIFKITAFLDDDPFFVFEFQDLSKKEVLPQNSNKSSESIEFNKIDEDFSDEH